MIIWVKVPRSDYLKTVEDVIRLFFPTVNLRLGEAAFYSSTEEATLRLEVTGRAAVTVRGTFYWKDQATDQVITETLEGDRENELRRLLRLVVRKLLEKVTGKYPGPWGILTGTRPVKIVNRLLDQGLSGKKVVDRLTNQYAVRRDKAELLLEVARRQRLFFLPGREAARTVSVYIGIPFCPTRCLYCSFPAYSLERHKSVVDVYLNALAEEIKAVGRAVKEQGMRVQSIYVGGGTPTSLTESQLERVLLLVEQNFVSGQTLEFTVEGGRPDTLSRKKLELCKRYGVNRISVNPQSMNDKTLEVIGRAHSAEEVKEAVYLVRELDFPVLNMDIIIGLPGETAEDVARTLENISGMKPENLTVHTMAVKRASYLNRQREFYELPDEKEVTKMLAFTKHYAREMGMHPYYLYRQKRILANLENVGYSLPGKESIYNIQMMEERQVILGLGAGAASKYVDWRDYSLVPGYNPKDPVVYASRINELIQQKIDKIRAIGYNVS
ncbi:coproporphyrinogen dehydrogenase HemZ [Calderihabitans maritimus]|uniref:Coproporphyrinogen III oxidase n=1 Tax=Calderihabitans maritimus TaxID=1246530 RepID=A0A1Z5HT49_9FIRM|nr:coproporphyrinogen dehydrogenase HemZ [Calderihabitans maritimus]GAW92694.1 coproporphyrinogen III oxidase [Calderihabitans maritimus]